MKIKFSIGSGTIIFMLGGINLTYRWRRRLVKSTIDPRMIFSGIEKDKARKRRLNLTAA
ncbi:MAG: hypothetical protein GY874_04040 [Desulfobacteraceae bacterium]|nr:hypothetical protein [Desulfobacteraceae bacterium]